MDGLRCRFEARMREKVTPGEATVGARKRRPEFGASQEMSELAHKEREKGAGELLGIYGGAQCMECS